MQSFQPSTASQLHSENDTSVRALRPCCLSDVEAIAFYAGEEPEKKVRAGVG